jgi:glutamyl-tRNA synthetase
MSYVRVRFAPSPTGDLHIGGIHTALFNWLFAKKKGGKFILRIEDTDEIRSNKMSVKIIFDVMEWLGINYDEGPSKKKYKLQNKSLMYYQMERSKKGIYLKYANNLIEKGFAYKCYCDDNINNIFYDKKKPYKHNCNCTNINEIYKNIKKKFVIRFKAKYYGKTIINDMIKGTIEFDNSFLDDFIIIKTNGVPTYNFACVIDDHLMKITHVLRGDDHISNTHRQIQIYNCLNWDIPKFAHMAMILGQDGSRLSKRHGHTSVLEYRKDGYIKDALINYLALLGWSTENSQQIFSTEELIEKFSIEKCGLSASIFDHSKLLWINAEKIRTKNADQLYVLFVDWLKYTKNESLIKNWDKNILKKAIYLEKDKIKLLKDIPKLVDFFFYKNLKYDKKSIEKIFFSDKFENSKEILEESLNIFRLQKSFSASNIEFCLRELAKNKKLKTWQVFHIIRVVISGKMDGPSLFHMIELIGKNEVIKRICIIIKILRKIK